jgi:hypothetical protein
VWRWASAQAQTDPIKSDLEVCRMMNAFLYGCAAAPNSGRSLVDAR